MKAICVFLVGTGLCLYLISRIVAHHTDKKILQWLIAAGLLLLAVALTGLVIIGFAKMLDIRC